jgi:hypothetical protein
MDRAEVEAAAARLYAEAGLEWHGNVCWARRPPPLTGDAGRDFRAGALRRCQVRRRGWWPVWRAVLWARSAAILGWAAGLGAVFGIALAPLAVLLAAFVYRLSAGAVVFGGELTAAAMVWIAVASARRGRPVLAGMASLFAVLLLIAVVITGLRALHRGGGSLLPALIVAAAGAGIGALCGIAAAIDTAARHELPALEPVTLPAHGLRFGDDLRAQPGDLGAAAVAAAIPTLPAWAWWPHTGVLIVCAAPLEISLERTGSQLRVHRADGAALRWSDGIDEHWWHGTRVPAGAIHGTWSAARIQGIRDTEERRAAIEIIGWPEFIRRANLPLVGTAPDPGNPGRDLTLHRLPDGRHLLLMTNGSPDRDGHQRVYAETVPGHLTDPIAAAAWQYGIPVDRYRALQRRT